MCMETFRKIKRLYRAREFFPYYTDLFAGLLQVIYKHGDVLPNFFWIHYDEHFILTDEVLNRFITIFQLHKSASYKVCNYAPAKYPNAYYIMLDTSKEL